MSELIGAKRIARKLSQLAGADISDRQVYRLANKENTPIVRVGRTVKAQEERIEAWWPSFAERQTNLSKRLVDPALLAECARMPKGRRQVAPARAQTKQGELRIAGVIGLDDLTTNAFLDRLNSLGDVDVIKVTINSDGGLVSDGLAIYHGLRSHKARVEVEIIGVAASMASAIAMAGDKISMAEDGLFMLHDPWTSAAGNADDLRAAADMLDKHGDSLAAIYARRTKFTEAQILDMMGRDGGAGTWLNAREALEMGFIDEILSPAEARLPNVPAAALAKRITRKGDRDVKKFAAKLKELIAAAVKKGGMPEKDVLARLAGEAQMTVDAVQKMLAGEAFPTLAQVRAFADVLDTSPKELRSLAEADGHKFDAPAPQNNGGTEGGGAPQPGAQPAQPAANQVQNQPPQQQQQIVVDSATVQAAVQAALQATQARQREIRAEASRFGLPEDVTNTIVDQATDIADARRRILDYLGDPANQPRIFSPTGFVSVTRDEAQKWLDGMSQWLIIKSGNARMVEAHLQKVSGRTQRLDAGEFRGFTLIDIARAALERAGVNTRGMSSREIAKRALIRGQSGLGTTSDFPILLENVLHKMLLAAYETTADKWRLICGVGSVSDFRDHPRLRLGTLPALSELLENGEFKQMHFPDAKKETIRAGTKGNIIGLTRQSIVNDDVDGFSRMTVMLGRAAARSIEIDVFKLINLNNGLGPMMSDGKTLFHSDHSNVAASAGKPGVATIEAGRVLMAQQKDPSGNDYLDIRPDVWLGPIGLGADARTAIGAEFDFDAAQSGGSSKFMKPNVVRDLLSTIVDTPRLTGNRWYLLADPTIAPVFEVVFLEGQEQPVIEVQDGFDYDGIQWKVRHDFGVGATDYVGAVTNAGA